MPASRLCGTGAEQRVPALRAANGCMRQLLHHDTVRLQQQLQRGVRPAHGLPEPCRAGLPARRGVVSALRLLLPLHAVLQRLHAWGHGVVGPGHQVCEGEHGTLLHRRPVHRRGVPQRPAGEPDELEWQRQQRLRRRSARGTPLVEHQLQQCQRRHLPRRRLRLFRLQRQMRPHEKQQPARRWLELLLEQQYHQRLPVRFWRRPHLPLGQPDGLQHRQQQCGRQTAVLPPRPEPVGAGGMPAQRHLVCGGHRRLQRRQRLRLRLGAGPQPHTAAHRLRPGKTRSGKPLCAAGQRLDIQVPCTQQHRRRHGDTGALQDHKHLR